MSVLAPKKIVVIGGGAIGSSIAYFLTRHRLFEPDIHSVTILEANKVAGGSSGKAGGFIAEWATPKCLAPLSFRTHNDLAKEHDGAEAWGHRHTYAAEVKLEARDLRDKGSKNNNNLDTAAVAYPKALDWLAPGAVRFYKEVGTPADSGQVQPFLFTETLTNLARKSGATLIIGSATRINYSEDRSSVDSVTFETKFGNVGTLPATDVVVAAGPWTSKLLPLMKLLAPRGHSIVVKPTRDLSPYILFPQISTGGKMTSPDIYPRPPDSLFDSHTVYASAPDDYSVPLPSGTDQVEIDDAQIEQLWESISGVSKEIHDGKVLFKQACYKPQIRQHEEGEEVGPIVGPMGGVRGLWLATGHDEWGIQNAPGTGVVVSEMILEGAAKSANCDSLHPKNFL